VSEPTLTWQCNSRSKYDRAYALITDNGIVARIIRQPSGDWFWYVNGYSMSAGREPTKIDAMRAAQSAWLKATEWVKL
jgi:hypothetical protein